MTNSTIPTYHKGQRNFGTGYDMMARIAELEGVVDLRQGECEAKRDIIAELEKANGHLRDNIRGLKRNIFRKTTRIEALESALDEIITEATSRNHAIDIARRARHGEGRG